MEEEGEVEQEENDYEVKEEDEWSSGEEKLFNEMKNKHSNVENDAAEDDCDDESWNSEDERMF